MQEIKLNKSEPLRLRVIGRNESTMFELSEQEDGSLKFLFYDGFSKTGSLYIDPVACNAFTVVPRGKPSPLED